MATMGRGYAVDLCSITGLNRYLALPETRGVGLSHRCKATPVSACAAQDFAAQLLPVLAPLLAQRNVPYALVSHSLGCWLAFELLRAARAARLPAPAAWCLSAMPAPDLPEAQRPWRQQRSLGTADFQVGGRVGVWALDYCMCVYGCV